MDRKAGQTPFTDEELTQALLRGTDEATRREGIVWSAITTRHAQTIAPRRPVWMTLAACGAAVVLLVAVIWALGNQLPTVDIARPLASGIQATPEVYLSADIQYYSPMLSSARGITISAHDSQGIPLPGDWSASWGIFLRPVGESTHALKYAIEALWTFPIGPGGSGDIPQSITITFSAPGHTPATMQLEQQRDMLGFVHVVQKLDALNLRVDYPGYNANPYRNVVSPPITVEAVDAEGNPVSGNWKTTFGRMSGLARNLSDTRVADDSRVRWSFEAVKADDIPAAAAITFTAPNGRTRTLHLFKDPDNPWSLRVAPEEILYIPTAPAETQPVSADPTPIPATDPSDPAPTELTLALPQWAPGVDSNAAALPLAQDAQPDMYRKYGGGFSRYQTQDVGTVALPKDWDLRMERKDEAAILDETGRAIGSLVCRWLDTDWIGDPAVFYSSLTENHTGRISFEQLDGYPWTAYRVLLEKDNGTAASGIPGVTVQSRTVFLPSTGICKDGKTYALAYMLTLDKAVTGNGTTEYLLSNETIDFIVATWEPPVRQPAPVSVVGLTAQQTVEAYFEAWNQKDQAAMDSHILDSRKGTDYEFDKLKNVQLLDCSDETQQMKSAFSKDWYSNPADIAVFRARLQYECKDPNGVCSGMTSGTYEMDYYLVKKTPDGPWVIVMWGNG